MNGEEDLESIPEESRHFNSVSNEEYDSAFEHDSDGERRRSKRTDLATKEKAAIQLPSNPKSLFVEEYSREEGRNQRFHYQSLDAYSRHKKFINDYLLYYPGSKDSLFKRDTSKDRTDFDVIRENHKFLWSEEDSADTWGKRLAKKYYEKLFREYCIADLSRYKDNKIAMRWRIEREVIDGKGQFICGDKSCQVKDGLRSWEVNFAYVEGGERKNALVKLRLCSDCSYKLNYRHQRREIKQRRKRTREHEGGERQKIIKTEKVPSEEKTKSSEVEAEAVTDPETESELWKRPVQLEDKSRDDEFDDYFQDLFL